MFSLSLGQREESKTIDTSKKDEIGLERGKEAMYPAMWLCHARACTCHCDMGRGLQPAHIASIFIHHVLDEGCIRYGNLLFRRKQGGSTHRAVGRKGLLGSAASTHQSRPQKNQGFCWGSQATQGRSLLRTLRAWGQMWTSHQEGQMYDSPLSAFSTSRSP